MTLNIQQYIYICMYSADKTSEAALKKLVGSVSNAESQKHIVFLSEHILDNLNCKGNYIRV